MDFSNNDSYLAIRRTAGFALGGCWLMGIGGPAALLERDLFRRGFF
jgi:hypothetical protein